MVESTDARRLPASVQHDKRTDARNSLAKRKTFSFVSSVVGEFDFTDQTRDHPCSDDLLALLLADLRQVPLEDLPNMSVFRLRVERVQGMGWCVLYLREDGIAEVFIIQQGHRIN